MQQQTPFIAGTALAHKALNTLHRHKLITGDKEGKEKAFFYAPIEKSTLLHVLFE